MITPSDLKLKVPPHALFRYGTPVISAGDRKPFTPEDPAKAPVYWLALLRLCQARYLGKQYMMRPQRNLREISILRYKSAPGVSCSLILFITGMFSWSGTPEKGVFWTNVNRHIIRFDATPEELPALLSRYAPDDAKRILEELDAFMSLLKKLELI